jgi:hypothetical protein
MSSAPEVGRKGSALGFTRLAVAALIIGLFARLALLLVLLLLLARLALLAILLLVLLRIAIGIMLAIADIVVVVFVGAHCISPASHALLIERMAARPRSSVGRIAGRVQSRWLGRARLA